MLPRPYNQPRLEGQQDRPVLHHYNLPTPNCPRTCLLYFRALTAWVAEEYVLLLNPSFAANLLLLSENRCHPH